MSDVIGIGQAASGVANAAATIAGANIQANASAHAADLAKQAADAALGFQQQTTARNQAVQDPFIQAGTSALDTQNNILQGYQGSLQPYLGAVASYQPLLAAEMPTVPQAMTQAQLEQTPGYQFQLQQGLKAVQENAAAKGLGLSGAALKGAANFATGLAASNYQQQFANQQQLFQNQQTRFGNVQTLAGNQQNILANQKGMLDSLLAGYTGRVGVGENAATGSGTQGQLGATNAGNIATGLGSANAAATLASGNAISGGINSLVNQSNQRQFINALQGNQGNNSGSIFGNQNTQASNDAFTKASGDTPWDEG